MTPTVEQGDLRERVEGDIRIAVWNTCCWQGKPQKVSQSFIMHLFDEEPCMVRAMSQVDAMRLRIERLEEALREINDDHLPDQPASSSLDETEWAIQHIRRMRSKARAALCDGVGG